MPKTMFLDESGDHNLLLIDPQYPVFVLGGIIIDDDYAAGPVEARLRDFKKQLFSNEGLVLHTADITRNRNGFERLKDTGFRNDFYNKLNALMAELDYKVVACAIHKNEHRELYGDAAIDPYMLCLNILVERFCYEIGNDTGTIVAERRNLILDGQLDLAWRDLTSTGTYHVKPQLLRRRVSSLALRSKSENIAGLQLADLVVSPIGRHILGKPTQEDFRIVEGKFRRRSNGDYRGHGLVELPKRKPAPATQ